VKYLIASLILIISSQAFSTEVLVWDSKPLEIRLEVGKERIVEFPDNIEVALPSKVLARMSFDSRSKVGYFLPRATFPKVRAKVRLVSTNELIFVEIFAVESTNDLPLENVKVILKSEKDKQDKDAQELMAQSNNVTLKELVQYVTHDFFAPPEFKKMSLPIQESRIQRPLNLDLMFTGFSAGLFDLEAVKQYRTQLYTLTAIKLTNRTNQVQPIIYSHLENNGYITASSQHRTVMAKGSDGQSTLLYYVTKKPLSENSDFL